MEDLNARRLVLLMSDSERPRLMRYGQLAKEFPGQPLMITGGDALAASGGALIVTVVADMSRSPVENEKKMFRALGLAYLCIKHKNFLTDDDMDGEMVNMLRAGIGMSYEAFGTQLGQQLSPTDIRKLELDAIRAAEKFVDCPCLGSMMLEAVTQQAADLTRQRLHRDGFVN